MSRFSRGAIVGTGALQGLGRAAAFASASFIGGAGLVYGIKSTVAAAMQSQAVLAQTENAVKRSGLSWDEYGKQIQAAALAQAQLSGFDDERLLQTFSTLVRRTGDVNRALQLNALATDVARGRGIELEAATQLVLKATLGQAGALRRLGIDAKVGASRLELVQLLSEKYAGSAAKFGDTAAGAQARFNVALQNTQEMIGTALLPTITDYLNKATDWLNSTKNQEKIQRDLNVAVGGTSVVVGGLTSLIGGLASAWDRLPNFGKDKGLADLLGGRFPGWNQGLLQILGLRGGGKALSPGQLALALAPLSPLARNVAPGTFNGPGVFGATQPPSQFDFGGKPTYTAAPVTRDQRTATALAAAQSGGVRAQITAAAKARIAFIDDTIAFANKLISQGRGNTAQLQATLQKFYAEKDSDQAIVQGFIDADTQESLERQRKAAEAFAESQQLLIEQRAASKQAWEDYLAEEAEANAETQRLLIEQRTASKEGYANYLKQQAEIRLETLQNNVLAATLIADPKREKSAEITAQKVLVKYYKNKQKGLQKDTIEYVEAHRDYLNALGQLRNLTQKNKAAEGFSLQQLFAEATSELAMYGSNIGAPGTPLSPQEGRGAFAGVVKAHQTVVVQNFHYPMSSSQALNDAHAGARNLKS